MFKITPEERRWAVIALLVCIIAANLVQSGEVGGGLPALVALVLVMDEPIR